MALVTCPDCGRTVSSVAFACPQCGRPMKGGEVPIAPSGSVNAESIEVSGTDATAQPVLKEWLGDLKKARELPARSKTCKRCDVDVTVDAYRRKVGDAYLCADCVYEEDERREARKAFFSRVMITLSVFTLLGVLTMVAIQVGPILFAPRSNTRK